MNRVGNVCSWAKDIEPEAVEQINNVAKMPFIFKHVSIMPDVHYGIGATIGSVIATKKAIIPASVGVDIGCGMSAIKTNLVASDLPESLKAIRDQIERDVPLGAGRHHDEKRFYDKINAFPPIASIIDGLKENFNSLPPSSTNKVSRDWVLQLGSLGSGNHFIEICLDESDCVWIMLHSGSRGLGNALGRYYIELAKEDMRKWFINLPDENLGYFPEGTDHFNDYWNAVCFAQQYAKVNRMFMLEIVMSAIKRHIPNITAHGDAIIDCHHNYCEIENHYSENVFITRKGAVRARIGDLGIIPGSMGAKSFIVTGKGNRESFHSCAHGAGRKMSRTKAKKQFTVEDLSAQTHGIECRKDADVLDEIPGAYKDIDEVMSQQADLVDIVHTLRQVLNVKG